MNYHEAMNATVSKEEARAEILARIKDDPEMPDPWGEFVTEFGDHDEYEGSDVLAFLGY